MASGNDEKTRSARSATGALPSETVDLDSLVPDPENARTHDKKNLDAIANSLRMHGQVENLVVQRSTRKIIGGNGRYEAMRAIGWTQAGVTMLDVDDMQAMSLGIALNRTGELASWNSDTLGSHLQALGEDGTRLEDLGFDDLDLSKLLSGINEGERANDHNLNDNDVHPGQAERVCSLGDVWALGEHRLLCGDATDKINMNSFIEKRTVDAVLTDPPYGISIVGPGNRVGAQFLNSVAKKGIYRAIQGDECAPDVSWLLSLAPMSIIWGGNYFCNQLPPSRSWLVWDKRVDSGIINTFADCEIAWSNYGGPSRIHRQLWNGMIREGEHTKRVHPTQKPIALLSWCLSFLKGKTVLDPYAGSGSTLIACETSRTKTCLSVEIDPLYCDVIIDRFKNLTGTDAKKINSQDSIGVP